MCSSDLISVSERRAVVNIYVDGRGFQLKPVSQLMAVVNQLTVAMQSTRATLDSALLRLSSLELDDFVSMHHITEVL